jgi:hypothetical protein
VSHTEPDPGEVAAFHAFAALPPKVQAEAKLAACLRYGTERRLPFGWLDLPPATRHEVQADAVEAFYRMHRAGTQAAP